ncbi:MAG: hypothetical protein RBS68_09455 [Anaerolineales bacterium]|jgi:cell division protein FtsL|nr:hypothetical protein [Anaerolineales bacterium]
MTTTSAAKPGKTKRVFAAYAEAVQTFDSARSMPLNVQRQWVILFAVVIAIVAMVAGLYLDVTARAAITGREIQKLELAIAFSARTNADYETDYARLMSNQVMQARASQAGFEMLDREQVDYMVVPGYLPASGITFASSLAETQSVSGAPEYHESLLTWLAEAAREASAPLGGLR